MEEMIRISMQLAIDSYILIKLAVRVKRCHGFWPAVEQLRHEIFGD